MKIKDLMENTSKLAQELMQPKYKEYSQGIKRLLNNDWRLVRGSGYYDLDSIGINKPRVDRKPAYANTMLYYYAFKNLEPWESLPPRSVICSTSIKYASSYVNSVSSVFYIIPKNGTVLCELPENDLWLSFNPSETMDKKKTFNLTRTGDDLETMSERIERLVTILNNDKKITSENFLSSLKIASDKLDNNDLLLAEFYFSKLSNVSFYDMVVDYFNININTESVNNINFENKNHEVWFSAEYLTIPYDMVHK